MLLTLVYYSTFALEAAALIASLYFFKKYKQHSEFISVPFYLALVVVVEFRIFFYQGYNIEVYNFTMPIENLFYLSLYLASLRNRLHKRIVMAFIVFYLVILFMNYIQLKSFRSELISYAYSFGAVSLLIANLFYLFSIVSGSGDFTWSHDLFFWIAQGIFIFLVLTLLKDTVNNLYDHLEMKYLILLKYIQCFASNILYTFYLIGFIRCKPIHK